MADSQFLICLFMYTAYFIVSTIGSRTFVSKVVKYIVLSGFVDPINLILVMDGCVLTVFDFDNCI